MLSCDDKFGQFLQLRHTNGRLHIGHFQIVANVGIDVFVVVAIGQIAQLVLKPFAARIVDSWRTPTITPPVAERFNQFFEQRLVGLHRATFACGDVMGGVKAGGGQMAETAC